MLCQLAEVRGEMSALEGEIAAATAEVRVVSGAYSGPVDSRWCHLVTALRLRWVVAVVRVSRKLLLSANSESISRCVLDVHCGRDAERFAACAAACGSVPLRSH